MERMFSRVSQLSVNIQMPYAKGIDMITLLFNGSESCTKYLKHDRIWKYVTKYYGFFVWRYTSRIEPVKDWLIVFCILFVNLKGVHPLCHLACRRIALACDVRSWWWCSTWYLHIASHVCARLSWHLYLCIDGIKCFLFISCV